jgi:uncharacterized Tic20 family protein/DNA-binding transcriptional regulator YiaG
MNKSLFSLWISTPKNMDTDFFSQRIKDLRNRKGFSQEGLSEKTGLSLRTIQRIEKGKTQPRGDSLKRLAKAFEVSPDEIMDWSIIEDKTFLTALNLSALGFVIFPLLGILIPLIVWVSKKDKIQNINEIAKEVLNFQITWTIILIFGYIVIVLSTLLKIKSFGNISPEIISPMLSIYLIFLGIMYSYNLILIITNSVRINKESKVNYYFKFRFLKN